MSQDEFRAPAGWYPDPLGHPQLRWWNSYGWTEQVSAAPEPITMREPQPRYAWKEEEPTVIPVQAQGTFAPAPPQAPVAPTLHEIEAPRTHAAYDNWQALQVPPTAPDQPASPALAQTPPPPYWDDDDGRPTPSVRPEDLKFWSGTNPAELRRRAREQGTN